MRADKFFAEKFGSRTKARHALESGLVLRKGAALSPSDEVNEGETFEFREEERFVSEGGYKLERGLETFSASVEGLVFADLGASTGGFCDCLLRRGAKRVYCVDVGKGLLDPRLAGDKRVTVMDGVNARYLTPDDFPEPLGGVVSDLSFISLRLILPAVRGLLQAGGRAFVLFKPQFECGGRGLGKSGILPRRLHGELLASFYDFSSALSLAPVGIVPAPLRPKKNVEYVVALEKDGTPLPRGEFLSRAEKNFENTL